MSALTIPARHHAALQDIRNLSEHAVAELASALDEAPPSAKVTELSTVASRRVASVPTEKLARIVDTLLALYIVRIQADVSAEIFTQDLVRAMNDSSDATLALPSEEVPAFSGRLSRLLNIKVLASIGKALSLRGEFPHTFCDAKILTDVRPVFGDDPDQSPVGFVLTHTLKIDYHQESDHKEFYITLDSHDLDTLQSVIERAKQKGKSVKALLKKAETADLEID